MAGSREAADLIRELVTEVGVEMDEEGAAVIDHLHYDANDDGQVIWMDFSILSALQQDI